MKVSIIIPTYNRKQLLYETLQTIFSQTLEPYEIIVVDDHSTDNTVDYLKKIFGKSIIITKSKNKGPGGARNTGIEIATGDYIKFFDSDDLMTNNALLEQVRALESSGKGFVYHPYFQGLKTNEGWSVPDNTIINYYPFPRRKGLTEWMMLGYFINLNAVLFRKEVIQEVGLWREDIYAYEDWEYLWRVSLLESDPAHTQACAFLYRIHGDQITVHQSHNLKRDQEKITMLNDIFTKYYPEQISTLNHLFFINMYYQTMRMHESREETFFITPNINKTLHEVVWNYIRLRKKYGRISTGTKWQPEHGPLINTKILKMYIDLLP